MTTRARVLVLRHALERFKHSNSGRLVAAAVRGAELHDWGVRGAPLADEAVARLCGDGAWLLWPDAEPARSAGAVVASLRTLVVLDGSWPQTRRMLQRIAPLARLPRLSLPAPEVAAPRLRRGRAAAEMSTLEAVAAALAVIDGEATARPLRALLARFAAASIPPHTRRPR